MGLTVASIFATHGKASPDDDDLERCNSLVEDSLWA